MSKKLKRALIAAGIVRFGLCNFSNFGNSYSDDDFTFETYTVKPGDTFRTISHYYRDKDSRNIYIFDYQDKLRRNFLPTVANSLLVISYRCVM